MAEEFPKYKFLALFHDPPWKPWSITGVTKGFLEEKAKEFNVSYYAESYERHENDGFTLAKIIGGLTDSEIEKYKKIVKNADIFSASMARQTVRGGTLQRQWKKVNVFNPNYYLELKENIDTNKILQYIYELHRETSQVSDTSLKYNITYGSMEALWYSLLGEKYVPLADTRVYTYTVFDHDYATVAMTNIISDCDNFSLREECFKGYIVKVDVPGVQSIISKSRKVLDLWGSSWLVSYLAFNTIYPLIRKYGADIVLSPFIGINPFFISKLIKESHVDISGLFGELSEIMKYPTQPVMPATVFLALPHDEDLERLYLKAWDDLIEVSEDIKVIDKEVIKFLKGKPIMPVRVTKIDVKEAIREFINSHPNYTESKYSPLFYSYLIEKVGRSSNIRVNYGATLYSWATAECRQDNKNLLSSWD